MIPILIQTVFNITDYCINQLCEVVICCSQLSAIMGRGSKLLARFARVVEETASRELNRASGVASRQQYGSSAKSLSQKRGLVQPAVAPSTTTVATPVFTDLVGAVSVASEQSQSLKPNVYYNVDGHRVDDGRFTSFAKDIAHFIPQARVFTDPLRTFAYGTDASFYRLNPKMVIKVHTEAEMQKLLPLAKKHDVPVTFRAAGTSLSGQAITDSVLLKISHTGKNFRNYEIHVRAPLVLASDSVSQYLRACGVQTAASQWAYVFHINTETAAIITTVASRMPYCFDLFSHTAVGA